MISIPDDLLAVLDAEAAARHMSRSATIVLAVQRGIRKPNSARVDELLADARAAVSDTGEWSAAEFVRDQRAGH